VDETLRDGLQSPSAHDPPLERKLELLHLMAALGIDCAALGYPAARKRQWDDVLALASELSRARLGMSACCAARALEQDIAPIADISQRAGLPLQVGLFVASSPLRRHTERWNLEDLQRRTECAVSFAVRQGLEVLYVAEDSTRAAPDVLEALYRTAIHCGATRVCVADTAGHATPRGAAAVVRFVRELLDRLNPAAQLDWHGHRDRGLDLANSLAAWDAGAERCHGTALGIGERCGNTPIELLLLSLVLDGRRTHDLTLLPRYAERAAAALGVSIPPNHPVVGRDAFRTGTGTHAAALVKGERLGTRSDRIDSGVPSRLIGRRPIIEIGPLSGNWNVIGWLAERGLPEDPALVQKILDAAKASDRVLEETEIWALVRRYEGPRDSAHSA
jgi:2-isopropylmalate synthase